MEKAWWIISLCPLQERDCVCVCLSSFVHSLLLETFSASGSNAFRALSLATNYHDCQVTFSWCAMLPESEVLPHLRKHTKSCLCSLQWQRESKELVLTDHIVSSYLELEGTCKDHQDAPRNISFQVSLFQSGWELWSITKTAGLL